MMSDVQFRCKGGVLQPAHRCILHARAPLLLDLVGPDGSAGRGGAGWKGVSPVRWCFWTWLAMRSSACCITCPRSIVAASVPEEVVTFLVAGIQCDELLNVITRS